MNNDTFDQQRRTFLIAAGWGAGGLAIAAVLPYSSALAQNAEAALASMQPFTSGGDESVWDIDSACGHFPPYSHAIPPAPAQQVAANHSHNGDPLHHCCFA